MANTRRCSLCLQQEMTIARAILCTLCHSNVTTKQSWMKCNLCCHMSLLSVLMHFHVVCASPCVLTVWLFEKIIFARVLFRLPSVYRPSLFPFGWRDVPPLFKVFFFLFSLLVFFFFSIFNRKWINFWNTLISIKTTLSRDFARLLPSLGSECCKCHLDKI